MKRSERFVLEKGMLLGHDAWWYVLVKAVFENGKTHLYCICDNANNIYSFTPDVVDTFLTPNEVGNANWSWPEDFNDEEDDKVATYRARSIPYDVVAEVLIGRHDDRFNHWATSTARGGL